MILANYLNTLVYETTFRIIGVKIEVDHINAVSILTAFFFTKKFLKGGHHVCDELNFNTKFPTPIIKKNQKKGEIYYAMGKTNQLLRRKSL